MITKQLIDIINKEKILLPKYAEEGVSKESILSSFIEVVLLNYKKFNGKKLTKENFYAIIDSINILDFVKKYFNKNLENEIKENEDAETVFYDFETLLTNHQLTDEDLQIICAFVLYMCHKLNIPFSKISKKIETKFLTWK